MKNIGEILQMMVDGTSEDEIKSELLEVCDCVHSSCDDTCPIHYYNLTGHPIDVSECECFKSGENMFNALFDYLHNTTGGKMVFRQQEFITWLRKRKIYNPIESGEVMQKMHRVWEEMQKDYEEFTAP